MPNANRMQTNMDATIFITSISHIFVISSDALAHILNRPIANAYTSNVVYFYKIEISSTFRQLTRIN